MLEFEMVYLQESHNKKKQQNSYIQSQLNKNLIHIFHENQLQIMWKLQNCF
jgi:hypothetical protein